MINSGIIASVPPFTPPDLPPNTRRISGKIDGELIWEFQSGIGDGYYNKLSTANNFRAIGYRSNDNGVGVVIRNIRGARWNQVRAGATGFVANFIIIGNDERRTSGQTLRNRITGIGCINATFDDNLTGFTMYTPFDDSNSIDCVINMSKVYTLNIGDGFIVNYIGLTYG